EPGLKCRGRHPVGERLREAHPDEQAATAYLLDERRVDAADDLADLLAPALGVADEVGCLDLTQHGVGGGRRERVATEGAAVVPALEELGCLAEGHERADGHATCDALRDRHGV